MLSKDCCMLIDYEMAMGKRSGMRFFTLPDFTLSDQPIRPGKPELSGHFFRHGIFQKGVQLVAGHKLPQRTLCQKIGQTLYVRQANNTAVSFDWIPVAGGLRGLGECRYPPLFFSKKIEYTATDTMVSSQG